MTFREGGLALWTMAPAAMLLGLLLAHTGLELLVDIVKWQACGALIRRLQQKQQDSGTGQDKNDIEDDCLWFQLHMVHAGYLQGTLVGHLEVAEVEQTQAQGQGGSF